MTLHRLDGVWALAFGQTLVPAGPKFPSDPDELLPPVAASATPVGVFLESNSLGQVVYRSRIGCKDGSEIHGVHACGFMRDDEAWALLEHQDFEALKPIIQDRHGLSSMVPKGGRM